MSAAPSIPPTRKMEMDSRINAGETPVSFDGQDLWLKPTIRAAQAINRQFDGFANARAALVRENFDATVFVLRMGLNLSDRDTKDLPERVYKNGMTAELLISLIKYVAILGNGGRPLPDEPEDNLDNLNTENLSPNG